MGPVSPRQSVARHNVRRLTPRPSWERALESATGTMKLSKWGLHIAMTYRCRFCGARPGELCSAGNNRKFTAAVPHHHDSGWEHGVHYDRNIDDRPPMLSHGDAMRAYKQTPYVPLDGSEDGVELIVKAMLEQAS